MKHLGIVMLLVAGSFSAMAQGSKVQSAITNIKPEYNQLDKAKEAIEAAILHEKTKDQAKTWKVRGDVYKAIAGTKNANFKALSENPLNEAMVSYKKAIKMDPKGGNSPFRKDINNQLKLMQYTAIDEAIAQFQSENYQRAMEYFEISLTIDSLASPSTVDSMIIFNAGMSAERAKNYSKAIQYYNRAIEINYEAVSSYAYVANIKKELGDTAAFISTLEEGINKFPNDNARLMIELINHYLLSGQSEKALTYLQKAIEADPQNHSFYFAEGTLFDKMGRLEDSKAAYEKAIEIKPDYFDAWYNLGVLYYNKAVEMSKAANDIPPREQKRYDEAVKAALEQMAKALPFFEKAHEIDAAEKNTIMTLREIYYKTRSAHPEYESKYKEYDDLLKSMN